MDRLPDVSIRHVTVVRNSCTANVALTFVSTVPGAEIIAQGG